MLQVLGWDSPSPPRPHLCTLLDISMGRPMFLDSRLKLGSKYSSAEIAVGLVGLAACCTGAKVWEECCWAMPRKDWNGVFPPGFTFVP